MKNWNFFKQPEFLVTTIIAIILTFVGGYFTGKSTYKQTVQTSPGSINTQGQSGDNLIDQSIDINEYPKPHFNYTITSLNQKLEDGLYATNVKIEYRSAPGIPLTPFNHSNQFISCVQLGKTNKALMPVNNIETWTTANYLCLSKEPVIEVGQLFKLSE